MLFDTTVCPKLTQEISNKFRCPANFSVEFPFESYFDLLVDYKSNPTDLAKYTNYLIPNNTWLTNITNPINGTVCVVPNFYCDTCDTNFYCNPEQEKRWLLDLYSSTNGQYWFNNTNWISENVDHCSGWYGVSCCDTIIHLHGNYSTFSQSIETLPYKCINHLNLDNNNVSGILPNYWPNSTIFSVVSISNNHVTNNALKGRLPNWSQNLTNLAAIEFVHQSFNNTGILPGFGLSNCTLVYDLHQSFVQHDVEIPEWNSQKYMITVELQNNKLNGTIPNWDKWVWPMFIKLAGQGVKCSLSGDLPKFNKHSCPLLIDFIIGGCQLNGEIKYFPNTLCIPDPKLVYWWENVTAAARLDYSNNNFSGTLPFDTLTTPSMSIFNCFFFAV